MLRLPTREQCVEWLQLILVLISHICSFCSMSLTRSRQTTLKWIKKRLSLPRRRHQQQQQQQRADTNTATAAAAAEEATTATTTSSEPGAELVDQGHLSEILVLNDTQIDGKSATSAPLAVAIDMDNMNNMDMDTDTSNDDDADMNEARAGHTAPTRNEDEEEDEEEEEEMREVVVEMLQQQQQQAEQQLSTLAKPNANYVCCQCPATEIATTATTTTTTTTGSMVNRSKSRVRSYLKKCKQRLTGQQSRLATATATTTTATITLIKNEAGGTAPTMQPQKELKEEEAEEEEQQDSSCGSRDSSSAYVECMPLDLSLRRAPAAPQESDEELEEPQREIEVEVEVVVEHSNEVTQLDATVDDGMLAQLIDSHLSHIYPIYWARTRAILMRQARELLVSHFEGCLPSFEQRFLCKFAQIAATLRATHQIGESWLWHPGWPLATSNGALVLQLSDSEIAHALQPAELYLCVKLESDAEATPQLYVVWRSSQQQQQQERSGRSTSCSELQTHCIDIDYNNPRQEPLSVLQLEMSMAAMATTTTTATAGQGQVNDAAIELPQLLQNLLVSVERSIERVSLNELQMPLALGEDQLDEANNNNNLNNNNTNNSNTNNNTNNIGSPKCALRRSDLITKNKLFNNRYMLRRLTNRQDSMNSTSSGNSNASERSSSSGSSSAGEELHSHLSSNSMNNNNNNNGNNDLLLPSTSPALPLFCLGNSFPHIDSDEEATDAGEKRQSLALQTERETTMETETELLPPNSISELPEKLLNSGVYLPGTRTLQGDPLVHVDGDAVASAGLNCYELATLLLYYSTIPERSIAAHKSTQQQQQQKQQPQQQLKPAQQTFTILIAIEKSQHLCVIDLICQSLKLLSKQIGNCEILAVCLDANLLQLCNQQQQQQQQQNSSSSNSCDQPEASPSSSSSHLVKFISVDQVTTSVAPSQLPRGLLRGQHHHDAVKWREFFAQLEAFQRQCSAAGGRLVAALSDIRAADLLGLPTRRQLYGQHRALSRALMDSQLHNLRKRGATQLQRLQEAASAINAPPATASVATSNSASASASSPSSCNSDAGQKLRKVTLLYSEVDRAAQRLEQLTEQRRERLRQLTRQRALEDEINEVTSWLASDGADNLQKFAQLQLDNEATLKAQELEFEKYYFIARKHLAKGRDLHLAANKIAVLSESAHNLKMALDQFSDKLEKTRERIEGGARLLHLLTQHQRETAALDELQRLAEELGATTLIEKHLPTMRKTSSLPTASSTPGPTTAKRGSYRCSSGNGSSFDGATGAGGSSHCSCWRESRNLEDMDEPEEEHDNDCDADADGEEQQSKIADSGVGVCDNCERNPKLARICSCQSLNEKSHDELLEDECFDRPTKRYMDMHSPMEANAHLQCHASSFELTTLEELSCLEPKIQKTLLLIMREMIGTERDYVRSLYYVIENYIDELLREDIPQPLRGQRNVIFGNIEKIFEFHNSHFLGELERYERNPLKVGAAFLEMESKFYLYALYNKNKPKSDTLLSEYGSSFFKPKQLQLQDKMDLASYLLKPVQRMGKYALLLQQLVKAVKSVEGAALQEIAADVEELQRAEEMVKFQLRHGNDLLAMDSLRDCDVNVKEQGRLLRQNEFLVWQGRGGKKTLRQVFLFEELVLFGKARRFPDHKNLDIYIYKNSIKTSDIGLTAHTGDSTTKFEIWFRKRKPDDTWTLQCMSEDIKNAWTEEISKLLWKQAKRNREIRLAEMSSMGIGSKPCLDIRPSHNQISDRSIPLAQLNKTPKLRHAEPGKGSMRRPNSLISESSLSSGTSTTSSSSISGGCSSSVHDTVTRHSLNLNFGKLSSSSNAVGSSNLNNTSATLELINETQALKLSHSSEADNRMSASTSTPSYAGNSHNSNSNTNSKSNKRQHKRSTTIVSQLSMESGILSDISVTPDQEHTHSAMEQLTGSRGSWSTASGTAASMASTSNSTVILRRYKSYAHAAESAEPEINK
ncbi:LOW QUALITY PROTEIN: uncharacterized protein LOC117567274 [Drosophila albomicans]|uniref:LOW QUALITY PROTEIN: uncharacterized protein LOC117567274 n=1 Tax=Drosophila albomicans TaxID=7291 RepID=A0A6P8WUE5_DROAB|nr:LOW QUALITY PROTEIN: uncharacterized protein LOC117567274 [Drosophila albomicans]